MKNAFIPGWVGLTVALFGAFSTKGYAEVPKERRELIVIANLSDRSNWLLRGMYRNEEWKAIRVTTQYTTDVYQRVHVIYPEEATKENFLNRIEDLEMNPTIDAIDVVIYLHGKREKICFIDTPDCYPMTDMAKDIKNLRSDSGGAPRKLRALYSDACWGKSHNDEWIDAGFKVVAGSIDQDANKTADLKKFLKSWTRGGTYKASLKKANSLWYLKPMDWVIGGNSHKVMQGAGEIRMTTDVSNESQPADQTLDSTIP